MRDASQFGWPKGCRSCKHLPLILGSCLLLVAPVFGQAGFGRTRGGYPLPSVSSIGAHYLPFPPPSVSSIPNTGLGNHFHNGAGFNRGGRFRGGAGWSYATPYYYIPLGDYGYGYDYDYVGGPDMYSGPPIGPNDPALHMLAERPPAPAYRGAADDMQAEAVPSEPEVEEQSSPAREAKPIEPTVLVFRDGHQQQVSNYAIMGQTVYVLDDRTQKIPLTNLDVPATIKANDDRGTEFKVPAVQHPAQKKNSDLQPNGTPNQNPPSPANVASAMP